MDLANPTTVLPLRRRASCACGQPASYCTAETDWLDTCGDCLRALRRGETPPVATPPPPPEAPMPAAAPLPPPGPAPAVKNPRRCYGLGCRRGAEAHGLCANCLSRARGRGLYDTAKARRLTGEELGMLKIPPNQARAKLQAATTPAPTVTAAPQTLDEPLGPDVADFVRSKMEQGAASEQVAGHREALVAIAENSLDGGAIAIARAALGLDPLTDGELAEAVRGRGALPEGLQKLCQPADPKLTTLEECDLAIVAIEQRRGQIEQVIELRARAVALIAEADAIEAGFGR